MQPHRIIRATKRLLLSTEANVVEFPIKVSPDAELRLRLGDEPMRCTTYRSLFTGRPCARVPATNANGVLVVQPFYPGDGPDGPADIPVGPAAHIILVSDPVLFEEAAMFLKQRPTRGGSVRENAPSIVSSAPQSSVSSDVDRSRSTEELLYLAHLMFDDDCDIDDLRSGCEAAGRLALLHLLRLFGAKLIAATERIGYDPKVLSRLNPPRTMHNVAACGCPDTLRALLAIIGLADERCDGLGETLLGGPDVPVDTGAVGDSIGWTPLHTAALSSSSPRNVDVTAAVELCVTMVGTCKDPHAWTNSPWRRRRADLQRRLHGDENYEEAAADDLIQFVHGLVDPDDTGSYRGSVGATTTDSYVGSDGYCGLATGAASPSSIASGEVRNSIHELYLSAAALAVNSVSSAAMAAVGEPKSGERPSLEYDAAVHHCMQTRANPATTWMASTILGDDACWETLCLIYECGAGSAAVWRTFPQKETVRALMHCLGMSKHGSAIELVRGWSDANDVTESHGLEGSLRRSSDCPGESVGKGERVETPSLTERFWETVRPLHVQTPWNRRDFSAMTFADAEVEANWKEESEEEDVAREVKFAAAAAAIGCAYRVARGDTEVVVDLLSWFRFPTRDGYGARDLGEDVPASAVLLFLRFLPVFFAGGFLLLTRITRNAEARHAAFVLYRLVDAALDVERVYASYDFLSDAVKKAPPPSLAAPLATLRNPAGRDRLGALVLRCAFPYLMPVTFQKHVATTAATALIAALRFGSPFAAGGSSGFDRGVDVAVILVATSLVSAAVYLREYRARFNFLMRNFAPRRDLAADRRERVAGIKYKVN